MISGWPAGNFPLDFRWFQRAETIEEKLLLYFYVLALWPPWKNAPGFSWQKWEKVFFMAKTIFHQIISCKNTMVSASVELHDGDQHQMVFKKFLVFI